METKKFKPFDKVLARFSGGKNKWICDFYSHYNTEIDRHVTLGFCDLENKDILPYEGNEHLVGTDLQADEEVRLEEGEWLMVCDDDSMFPELWRMRQYSSIGGNIRTYNSLVGNIVGWKYAIRFKDFDPSNMEETKKHILCVKNGKIIRYKG